MLIQIRIQILQNHMDPGGSGSATLVETKTTLAAGEDLAAIDGFKLEGGEARTSWRLKFGP